MEPSQKLIEPGQQRMSFSKDKSILNDIAQETQNTPGYTSLTEEELVEKVETILLERIKAGNKHAYFQLGLFYYEQGLYDKSFIYFERSKEFDLQALYILACMLYDGVGCKKPDEKLAVEYLLKISESEAKKAKSIKYAANYNIGKAYFQGYGIKQSDENALRYWLLAADDGNPQASVKAQCMLGMYYSRPESYDAKKAFFWHNEACGNGSLESQGAIGVMYEYGVGIKQDTSAAYECLCEASERGNVYAMGNLIAHYYKRKLYTKASDLASKVAQFSDVELLSSETDCLPQYVRKGISLACFYYARCLHLGHGVKKDEAEAKIYYSKSYKYDDSACAKLQNITQHGSI